MIVRMHAAATSAEREAVTAALRSAGAAAEPAESGALLVLDRSLDEGQAVEIAALPGVEAIGPLPADVRTLRDALLDWVASAAAVLGVLLLLAALFPVELGSPADPAQSPADLEPAWPVLPLHALAVRLPGWTPVPLAALAFAAALLAWPLLARGLAARRPRIHTALGVGAILAIVGLTLLEVLQ